MTTFSVLIVESQDIVRYGLEMLVLASSGLKLVGTAPDLGTALQEIRQRAPDVVVTELALPDSRGLETVRAVVAAQGPRHTLVVTDHNEVLYGEQVLALGAAGYLMKNAAQAELARAVLAVAEGQRWISPALNAHLVNRTLQRSRFVQSGQAALTARELEVLEQLKEGKSTKQIAAALAISPRTVDLYRTRIKKKLGLRTGAELIAYASLHF